jgi:hypothetical protein
MKKLLNNFKNFFNLLIDALIEARKARAEAITKGIGR